MQRQIVRAIIINNERVLLAKCTSASNYFLPGGGIEEGENPRQALNRELQEELDCDTAVDHLVDIHDHTWKNGEDVVNEKIFLFAARINCENVDEIVAVESHIEFYWVHLFDLNATRLLPANHAHIILKFAQKTIIY
jgi:8-oxo-dGTP diphosphatase